MGNDLRLRRWQKEDCRIIHDWRVHPDNSRWFADQKTFSYAEHQAWFERTLADPAIIAFILEQAGRPVAQIRFNPAEMPYCYRIAVSVAPGEGGNGFGSWLLRSAVQSSELQQVARLLIAETMVANVPSQKIFVRNGFFGVGSMNNSGSEFCCWAMPIGRATTEPVPLHILAEAPLIDECAAVLARSGLGIPGDMESPVKVFFDAATDDSSDEDKVIFHFNRVNGQCILDLALRTGHELELPIVFANELLAILQTAAALKK